MARVDDEIARLVAEDGYYVVARSDRHVELERKNPWLAVVTAAVLSSLPAIAGGGGGGGGFRRTERIYLDVDESGEAIVQLRRPDAEG